MPILNYTTKISSQKTISEISSILASHGARAISVDYDDSGQPMGLVFLIEASGVNLNFRLPSRHQGIYKLLCDDPKVPKRLKDEGQARRVAWRIVKDWVEAQVAIIDAGLAELPEVFLPYVVMRDGQTLYSSAARSNFRLQSGGE